MTEAIQLRPKVREVMRLAPERQWSLAALHAQLRGLIPDVSDVDVETALNWNLGKQYVRTFTNSELAVQVWVLTDAGKAA